MPLGYDHLTQGYSTPQRLTVQQGTGWGALGFAAQYEEGFSGQHAGDLLVIVDEASGISAPIWSAIYGLAATRLVVAGNPIRYDCHFRELYDRAAAGSSTITAVPISSLDSPDAALDVSPVGMASRSFLRQMREIHGENSSWWRSNILGLFPGQETARFIPAAWLDACTPEDVTRDPLWRDYPAETRFMGIDIGGGVGGDRSVIVVRSNKQLLAVFASEWHGVLDDARHRLEPVVVELARRWGVPAGQIVYDMAGIGRSFGSYLASYGLPGAAGYFGAGRGGQRTSTAARPTPLRCGAGSTRTATDLSRSTVAASPSGPTCARSWPSSTARPWRSRNRRSSSSSKRKRPSPHASTARPTCSMHS